MTSFIRGFAKRGGGAFFLSSVFGKIISILIPLSMIRMVSLNEYGNFEFYKSVVFILIPFYCLGLHEALLKFGSERNNEEVAGIFKILFVPSLIFSILIFALINFAAFFFREKNIFLDNLGILSIYVITNGMLLFILNYFRAIKDNNVYAAITFSNSSLLIFLFFLFFVIEIEYFAAWAYAVSPLICIALFLPGLLRNFTCEKSINIEMVGFVKYGIFVGFGGIASQLALVLDAIMIGVMLKDDASVGIYRMLSIVPSLILFFSSVFLKSDFAHIVSSGIYGSMDYLKSFIINMAPLYFFVVFLIFFFRDEFSSIVFDRVFSEDEGVILAVLLLGSAFSFFIRIPCGNILNALGYAKFNVNNALIALLFNIIFNVVLIPVYGILGAALSTLLSLALTSILQIVKIKKIRGLA